jgi:cytochrome P450
MTAPKDPFRSARQDPGTMSMQAEGRDLPLILKLQDLRKACKDWKTFSNDDPFMIVPHSEADVRSVRQYPIETDPPEHTQYRGLVEPFFNRPHDPEYQADMQRLVDRMVDRATQQGQLDAVRGFALPLQSRSLTRLLNVDEAEAERWISWGTHVFKDGDGVSKGSGLSDYIRQKFEQTAGSDGDDFFSTLNRAEFDGRPLSTEEKHGFANMAFAGGRDTVIHTVSSILAHLAEHPEDLEQLRADEALITTATEEFVRWVSPLTAIARRCPHGAQVGGTPVPEGGRVGLCWPSGNRDEGTFDRPDEVVLDRSPNPHIGFGFGVHRCLGAPQARLIIRSLLRSLCRQVAAIRLIDAEPEVEHESSFSRQVGYARLDVRFEPVTG